MAERIVSPGVFTQEKDLSFLPQGIANIGAALVGPTIKGPAFVPTLVNSYSEFVMKFGGLTEKSYLPYTAKYYLSNAGSATIVRVLGTDGYKLTHPLAVVATGSWGSRLMAFLHPTYVVTTADASALFEKSTLASNTSGSFVLTVSGSYTTDVSSFTNATSRNGVAISASIDSNSSNWLGKIYGFTPYGKEPVYNYVNFKFDASASLASVPATSIILQSGSLSSQEWDFQNDYSHASTPWITSQQVGGITRNLFKFHTLSHGDITNHEFKIGIANVKAAGTIAGSSYGQFDVVVRHVDQSNIVGSPFDYDDDDLRQSIVEQFTCNLDPDSPLFISRVIGDKYYTVDDEGTVSTNGDYANNSRHIRVEVDESVANGGISPELVPFGFRALYSPIPTGYTQPISASFKTTQTAGGSYSKRAYYGFDFDFANNDNANYLKPLPVTAKLTTGSNADFLLSNYSQHASSGYPTAASTYSGSVDLSTNTSIDTRKFIVPFQGGFDGSKPHRQIKTGTHIAAANTQGFDISSTSATGYTAYKKAIDAVSNKDDYDINMIVTPGVLHNYHSAVTDYVKTMCEERSDVFYVMDSSAIGDNVDTVTTTVQAFNSNYVATYYPWVKVMDTDKNKPVWVPPSVVMPGVIAYSDRVGAPWFAPAGLNRGGLPNVLEPKIKLNQTKRDTLYENRINPIATFPGNGVVVWGQKTLQDKPSALDRINVRRLLTETKKYISSATRYLVFENNTSQTRARFLNIVNPYLESIQQRQGLYAFRVRMDETNNTPESIDRYILYGELFLQPAKSVEFIKLDFNITPTGATFDE